jgi:hypothetical protein
VQRQQNHAEIRHSLSRGEKVSHGLTNHRRQSRGRTRRRPAARRTARCRARAPGRLAEGPEPPLDEWRGFLAASIRMHCHLLRRSAAMRAA